MTRADSILENPARAQSSQSRGGASKSMESARGRLSQRRLCTDQLRENEGREGGKREDRAEQRRDNRLHGADHLVVVVGQSRTPGKGQAPSSKQTGKAGARRGRIRRLPNLARALSLTGLTGRLAHRCAAEGGRLQCLLIASCILLISHKWTPYGLDCIRWRRGGGASVAAFFLLRHPTVGERSKAPHLWSGRKLSAVAGITGSAAATSRAAP
jgi:hypothetical protein